MVCVLVIAVAFGGSFFHVDAGNAPVQAKRGGDKDFRERAGRMVRDTWRSDFSADNDEFQTRQLVAWGEVTNDYGATQILSDGEMNILEYPTIEYARRAYHELKRQKTVTHVDINRVIENKKAVPFHPTPFLNDRWGAVRMSADKMKGYITANRDVTTPLTVAVVDSGLDVNHNFTTGRVSPIRYNFIDDNTNVADDTGHGTHVSGTIIDLTPSNVKIMPIKTFIENKSTDMAIYLGIKHAVDNGAKVINMSFGGEGYSHTMHQAIKYAIKHGVHLVAAAGNEGQDTADIYPANFAGVITVSAIDKHNNIASFSNYGSAVDVAGAGVNILSIYPNNQYAYASGTSMAAPHITAAVVMFYMYDPTMTNAQMRSVVRDTAVDAGDVGWDEYYGAGIFDFNASDIFIEPVIEPEVNPTDPPEETTPDPEPQPPNQELPTINPPTITPAPEPETPETPITPAPEPTPEPETPITSPVIENPVVDTGHENDKDTNFVPPAKTNNFKKYVPYAVGGGILIIFSFSLVFVRKLW